MRPYHSVVYGTLAYQQLALKVFCTRDKAGLLETVSVGLVGLHIALAVHNLIPFPVNDRTSGHTNLEYFGVVDHKRYGHESAVTPAMNAYTVLVHPIMAHKPLHALHLVGHLGLSAILMDGFLIIGSVMLGAAVVHYKHHVSVLGHIHLPCAQQGIERVGNHLRVRAAVNIKYYRIFLVWVKVDRLDKAVVVVKLAVGALD